MKLFEYTKDQIDAVTRWQEDISGIMLDRDTVEYDPQTGSIYLIEKFTDGHTTLEANRMGPVEYGRRFEINRRLAKMILDLHGMAGERSDELGRETKQMVETFNFAMIKDYGVEIVGKESLYELFPETLQALLPTVETMIQSKSMGFPFILSQITKEAKHECLSHMLK